VQSAVDEGTFIETDPRLVALTLMSSNEGSQNWYRQRDRRRLDGRPAGRPPRYAPHELGEHMAVTGVRALLRRPAHLSVLQREAARYDDAEDIDLGP